MKSIFLSLEIILISLLLSGFVFSQGNNEKLLARTWKMDKQSISGIVINSNLEVQKDFLQLKKDSTFERVDEGISYSGKWNWDKKNERIKLTYDHINREVFFKVQKFDRDNLVLKIEEDWKNEMLMYFSAVRFPCNI